MSLTNAEIKGMQRMELEQELRLAQRQIEILDRAIARLNQKKNEAGMGDDRRWPQPKGESVRVPREGRVR